MQRVTTANGCDSGARFPVRVRRQFYPSTTAEGWDIEPAWSPDTKLHSSLFQPSFQLRLIHATNSYVKLPGRLAQEAESSSIPTASGCSASSGALASRTVSRVRSGYRRAEAGAHPLKPSCPHAGRFPRRTVHSLHANQDRPGEQDGIDGRKLICGKSPPTVASLNTSLDTSRIYGLCWDSADRGVFVTTDRGTAFNDVGTFRPSSRSPTRGRLRLGRRTRHGHPSAAMDAGWCTQRITKARRDWFCKICDGQAEPAVEGVVTSNPGLRGDCRARSTDRRAERGAPTVKQQAGKIPCADGRSTGDSGHGHFGCCNQTTLALPVVFTDHRPGFESRTVKREITRKPANERGHPPGTLDRHGRGGWFSGENHIHANYGYGRHNTPLSVLDMCEGEDLNVGNIMVANSDGDGVFDRQLFLGRPDPHSKPRSIVYWNEEFRSTLWGHMTLIDLKHLVEPIFTGFKDTTNPWDVPTNADIAERTHHQHGAVSYTHPANNPESPYDGAYSAKGLPVDAALGRIDTLDVMGFGYEASLRLWYRLLNCGFRLPAAAGTDCFLNRINSYPPGWGRAYVQLTNGLAYKGWVEGQRAGRSLSRPAHVGVHRGRR